jgi:hypothetical protein
MREIKRRYSGDCPLCGSEDIVGGDVDVGCYVTIQECYCNACNAEWEDAYTMESSRIKRESDENPEA